MSILIFCDQADGHVKKASLEAICYGAKLAEMMSTTAEAVVLGTVSDAELATLGQYGVSKVHHDANTNLDALDAQLYTNAIAAAAKACDAKVIVFSHNFAGKTVAPRLSVQLKAGMVAGANALPELTNGFVVRKSVFSGKAYAHVGVTSEVKIISLLPNAYNVTTTDATATVVAFDGGASAGRKVKVVATNKITGEVPLTEAELVISGGRGLKGPENWGMVTDLAHLIGAATACSRAVADAHWRPHHEHVGQTGIAIAPNLYFAIGISGAIQHLAGVNRSKVIVVVNKDPEAPFFKAADYGIVGDAFEVMPKVIAAVKKLKGVA
jgi:electron transfer flavoprotein alpha subunit